MTTQTRETETMINPTEVIDERGEHGRIRVVRETLTDGSHVYGVWLDDARPGAIGYRVEWGCESEQAALDLADALGEFPPHSIGVL